MTALLSTLPLLYYTGPKIRLYVIYFRGCHTTEDAQVVMSDAEKQVHAFVSDFIIVPYSMKSLRPRLRWLIDFIGTSISSLLVLIKHQT